MTPLSRRQVLRLSSGLGIAGLAGCTSGLGTGASEPVEQTCEDHVYRASESDAAGELPWHVFISDIPLSTYSVTLSVADVSGGIPKEVVSCTATKPAQSQLVFDLSPETPYRLQARLNRPENPVEATATVSGWNRVTGANEALRVAVDNDGFGVQHIHYDVAETPSNGA